MLRPELQDMDAFADGMDNMVGAHRRAAETYFEDGSIEGACPPLKALLYIMRDGSYEGRTLDDPDLRAMFTRESILKSEWYAERLITRQQIELAALQNTIRGLSAQDSKTEDAAAAPAEGASVPAAEPAAEEKPAARKPAAKKTAAARKTTTKKATAAKTTAKKTTTKKTTKKAEE